MRRREALHARFYLGLSVLLGIPVLLEPDLRLPLEDDIQWGVHLLSRPGRFVRTVFGPSQARAPGLPSLPGRRDRAKVRRLFEVLDSAALPSLPLEGWKVLPLVVRRAEGRGGGGLEDELLLELPHSVQEAEALEGLPLLSGDQVCGRVRRAASSSRRRRLLAEGLLRVRLLNGASSLGETGPDRWVARAGPGRGGGTEIRLLLEPAGTHDPWPLKALHSTSLQCDTSSPGSFPFLARLARSPFLHPRLPRGLLLGRIRDRLYPGRSFVVERFVEPLWHPKALVRVSLLLPPERAELHALLSRRLAKQGLPGRHPLGARVLWRSPPGLSFRRYLLEGRGLTPGAAVMDGLRCLGRILWVRGDLALAAPLSERGRVLPLLWMDPNNTRVESLVVEGAEDRGRTEAFRLVFPPDSPAGTFEGGRLYTGTLGRGFPHGLILGEGCRQSGSLLLLRRSRDWPARVSVADGRGLR